MTKSEREELLSSDRVWTAQEVFSFSRSHVLEQGMPAIYDGVCKYRKGELSCGVGCFMTDTLYSPSLEGRSVSDDWDIVRFALPAGMRGHRELLVSLQVAHDEAHRDTGDKLSFLDAYRLEVADVAHTYGLEDR